MQKKTQVDRINVLGMRVDMVQIPDVLRIMEEWIVNRDFGNNIVTSNAKNIILSKEEIEIREAVNNSSLSVPDGISLILVARMLGYHLKERVYGPDLMLGFLRATQNKGYSHFFYGSTPEILDLLIKNLKAKFPGLKIAGYHSPPFRELTEEEDKKAVEVINKVSPDVLWIGLGGVKQELWMYNHRDRSKVPVMVGVGAAFDFLSGTKKQAPKWMQKSGLEWLFRLITEPRRLWKRYILGNSIFIYLICKELISGRLLKEKNKYRKQKGKTVK